MKNKYLKILALLLAFGGTGVSLRAQNLDCASDALVPTSDAQYTHIAINSGNWDAASTWNNGTIPGAGAVVDIPLNTVVTVNGVFATAPLNTVVVTGTLQFTPTANSELLVGTIAVTDTGVLTVGTVGAPIPSNFTARITITSTDPCIYPGANDPTVLGRGIVSDGNIQMYGAAKTAFLPLAGQSAPIGTNSLVLDSAPSGWQIGDQIVVPDTAFFRSFALTDMTQNGYLKNEVRTITAINGSTISLNSALIYNHSCVGVANGQIHIANLTRNVVVRSQNFVDQSYQDISNIATRGHVMTCRNNASFYNAAFVGLGRTNKRQLTTDPNPGIPASYDNPRTRYALHFHEGGVRDLTQVPGVVSGCVVNDTPGWGFVNHSSFVQMDNNVAYNFAGAGFVTQDGDEAGDFTHCFAVGGTGLGRFPYARTVFGDNPRMSHTDFGFHGDGFWFQGPDVRCIDNVAAACKGSGFIFWAVGRMNEITKGMTGFPRTRTATRCRNYRDTGEFVTSHVQLRKVSGNTAYACMTGMKFRFQNNIGSSAINGFPGTLFSRVEGQNVFKNGTVSNTFIWNCLNGLHSGYQRNLIVDGLTVDWVATTSAKGGVGVDANKVVDFMVYKNITISNMTTAMYTGGTVTTSNLLFTNCTQGIVRSNVLGHTNFGQQFSDLPSLPHPQSGPSSTNFTAVADGPINSSVTWGRPAPVAGDANYWAVNGANVSMTTATETFNGRTLALEDGSVFNPGFNAAVLTCRNLILDGGTISTTNDNGATIDLGASGNAFTLNDGDLKAGGANNTRNLVFRNGALAGAGLIDILAGGTTGSVVEFQSTIDTTGFTGTFSVHDNGILKLPAISVANGSFSLDLKGNGKYANTADVALKFLIIDGFDVAPGTYVFADFPANQQAFLQNNGGTITVLP